jgi:hypothetical protein
MSFNLSGFKFRVVRVVGVMFPATARDAGMPPTFSIHRALVSRLGFLGVLTIFVRRTRPADALRGGMFFSHRYLSCW